MPIHVRRQARPVLVAWILLFGSGFGFYLLKDCEEGSFADTRFFRYKMLILHGLFPVRGAACLVPEFRLLARFSRRRRNHAVIGF